MAPFQNNGFGLGGFGSAKSTKQGFTLKSGTEKIGTTSSSSKGLATGLLPVQGKLSQEDKGSQKKPAETNVSIATGSQETLSSSDSSSDSEEEEEEPTAVADQKQTGDLIIRPLLEYITRLEARVASLDNKVEDVKGDICRNVDIAIQQSVKVHRASAQDIRNATVSLQKSVITHNNSVLEEIRSLTSQLAGLQRWVVEDRTILQNQCIKQEAELVELRGEVAELCKVAALRNKDNTRRREKKGKDRERSLTALGVKHKHGSSKDGSPSRGLFR